MSHILEPWAPGAATSIQSYEEAGVAVIETSQAWVPFEGHDTSELLYDFGIEIEVSQYNDAVIPTVPGGLRPECIWASSPAAECQDGFWASRDGSGNDAIYSWAVRTETGDPIEHEQIGAYWDWADVLDECSRQSMTIGIAHPQSIPPNPAGVQAVETEIRAPRGDVSVTNFGAAYDTVYNDCEYIRVGGVSVPNPVPSTPSSWCMAISSNYDYPESEDGFQRIVNRNREYLLPTCTFTYQGDGYLADPYVEERVCP